MTSLETIRAVVIAATVLALIIRKQMQVKPVRANVPWFVAGAVAAIGITDLGGFLAGQPQDPAIWGIRCGRPPRSRGRPWCRPRPHNEDMEGRGWGLPQAGYLGDYSILGCFDSGPCYARSFRPFGAGDASALLRPHTGSAGLRAVVPCQGRPITAMLHARNVVSSARRARFLLLRHFSRHAHPEAIEGQGDFAVRSRQQGNAFQQSEKQITSPFGTCCFHANMILAMGIDASCPSINP